MSGRWTFPLAGFAVALAPIGAVGVTVLALLARTFRTRGVARKHWLRLVAWTVAGVSWTLTPAFAGDLLGVLQSVAEVGSLAIVVEAGALLARSIGGPHRFAVGAAAALVFMAIVSAVELSIGSQAGAGLGSAIVPPAFALGADPLAYPGRASGWVGHPNLWGALGVLAGVGVLSASSGRGWIALLGGTASLFVVLASGSRTALVALLVGGAVALLGRTSVGRRGRRRAIAVAAGVVALAVGVWLTFFSFGGRWDVSAYLGRPSANEPVTNLFRSSEDVLRDGSQWHRAGVTVRSLPAPEAGVNAVRLSKTAPLPDARVFQAVRVEPGLHYTLSVELRPRSREQRYGIAGWGRPTPETEQASLNLAHRGDGLWRATSAGGIQVLGWEVGVLDDGWLAGRATFRYEGETAITWRVGPTVDQSSDPESVSAWLDVRRLQMVAGDGEDLAYQATSIRSRQRADSLAAVSDRLTIYRLAWDGILREPWLGWWYPTTPSSGVEADAPLGATHAHNIVLETMYRRGAFGLFAMGIMVAFVVRAASFAARRGMAVVIVLAVLNVADALFWPAGIVHGAGLWIALLAGDQLEHVRPHASALEFDAS